MTKPGNVLAAIVIAIGAVIASINVASADDPRGCRAKVRAELGIAPYTGHSYPGFYDRVNRCLSAAQSKQPLTRQATRESEPARPPRATAERAESNKPSPSPARSKSERRDRQDKYDRQPETHSATLQEPSRPIPLPALAKPASIGEFGRRVALVIGNSKYEYVPTLPNAANDAEGIAKALTATGFQSVTLKTDLTREQILSALADFAKLADTADWATVYYSGHGIESRGANYIIPVDAQLKVDRDVDLEAIDVSKVLSAIESARKLKLVILDACRDNPFLYQMKRTVATRSISRGLAPIEPDAGILIVYAAKHGEVALDGDGKDSPFATALMNRIQTPNLELRRLFDVVRDDVMTMTARRQQPFSYGSLSGSEDFFFETR